MPTFLETFVRSLLINIDDLADLLGRSGLTPKDVIKFLRIIHPTFPADVIRMKAKNKDFNQLFSSDGKPPEFGNKKNDIPAMVEFIKNNQDKPFFKSMLDKIRAILNEAIGKKEAGEDPRQLEGLGEEREEEKGPQEDPLAAEAPRARPQAPPQAEVEGQLLVDQLGQNPQPDEGKVAVEEPIERPLEENKQPDFAVQVPQQIDIQINDPIVAPLAGGLPGEQQEDIEEKEIEVEDELGFELEPSVLASMVRNQDYEVKNGELEDLAVPQSRSRDFEREREVEKLPADNSSVREAYKALQRKTNIAIRLDEIRDQAQSRISDPTIISAIDRAEREVELASDMADSQNDSIDIENLAAQMLLQELDNPNIDEINAIPWLTAAIAFGAQIANDKFDVPSGGTLQSLSGLLAAAGYILGGSLYDTFFQEGFEEKPADIESEIPERARPWGPRPPRSAGAIDPNERKGADRPQEPRRPPERARPFEGEMPLPGGVRQPGVRDRLARDIGRFMRDNPQLRQQFGGNIRAFRQAVWNMAGDLMNAPLGPAGLAGAGFGVLAELFNRHFGVKDLKDLDLKDFDITDFDNIKTDNIKKIQLSKEDIAKLKSEMEGVRGSQDKDIEPVVGDLRPSFFSLGTNADTETKQQALMEKVRFAKFNHVEEGFGEGTQNPLYLANKKWDREVRYVNNYVPVPTYVEPDYVPRVYPTPDVYQEIPVRTRTGEYQTLLLRDISNNTARLQPVNSVGTMRIGVPLARINQPNTDYRRYRATQQSYFPPQGTSEKSLPPSLGPVGLMMNTGIWQTGISSTSF